MCKVLRLHLSAHFQVCYKYSCLCQCAFFRAYISAFHILQYYLIHFNHFLLVWVTKSLNHSNVDYYSIYDVSCIGKPSQLQTIKQFSKPKSTCGKNHLNHVPQSVSFSLKSSYGIPDVLGVQTEIQNFAKSTAYAIFMRSGNNRINVSCECQFLRQSHRRQRSAHFCKLTILIFRVMSHSEQRSVSPPITTVIFQSLEPTKAVIGWDVSYESKKRSE